MPFMKAETHLSGQIKKNRKSTQHAEILKARVSINEKFYRKDEGISIEDVDKTEDECLATVDEEWRLDDSEKEYIRDHRFSVFFKDQFDTVSP